MKPDECPKCRVKLERNYGLAGVVGICPECKEEYVKLFDRLILKKDFHKEVDAWHN